MLGEITVAQNIANLAKDGAKFIEQDGKYYAQNKDGSSVRVSKSAYNYGKWLNDNGVFYTLNQNAEVPKKINGKYVSKSVTTFIASRGGTDAVVQTPNFSKIRHFTFWAYLLTRQHICFVLLYMMYFWDFSHYAFIAILHINSALFLYLLHIEYAAPVW